MSLIWSMPAAIIHGLNNVTPCTFMLVLCSPPSAVRPVSRSILCPLRATYTILILPLVLWAFSSLDLCSNWLSSMYYWSPIVWLFDFNLGMCICPTPSTASTAILEAASLFSTVVRTNNFTSWFI